jgi:prefoldin alpha subunit
LRPYANHSYFAAHPHLIPLTSSLYVPGYFAHNAPAALRSSVLDDHLSDALSKSEPSFLVDLGTGFLATYNATDAGNFYDRKISDLDTNLKDLENIVNSKAQTAKVIEDVLRQKIMAAQQAETSKKD